MARKKNKKEKEDMIRIEGEDEIKTAAEEETEEVLQEPAEETEASEPEDVQEEVNDGVEPLVAKSAVPIMQLVEACVLAIAAGKNNHTGAEKGHNTFFHFIYSLRVGYRFLTTRKI